MTREELASIREVHTLLGDVEERFGERLDDITEQVTSLRLTIAKWAGVAAVVLFLANFAGAWFLSRPSSTPGPQGSAGSAGPAGPAGAAGAPAAPVTAAAPAPSQRVTVEPAVPSQPPSPRPPSAVTTTTTTSTPPRGPCVSQRLIAVCPGAAP